MREHLASKSFQQALIQNGLKIICKDLKGIYTPCSRGGGLPRYIICIPPFAKSAKDGAPSSVWQGAARDQLIPGPLIIPIVRRVRTIFCKERM
jgi:tRNA1(Val) A37 N6-methylase TrmN6